MRTIKQFIPLLILLSFAVYSVYGVTIYAAPNGVKVAPCDISTPCDIYYAVSYANESDVVYCQEGNYFISTPLTIEAANLTLVGQSQVNTTLELAQNTSSGIRAKSTFHMQNFTVYMVGFQTYYNQYPIEIKESSSSDFIVGVVEDITFTGSFSQMTSLICIIANNGSATIRNINVNQVISQLNQFIEVQSPITTIDQITILDSSVYEAFDIDAEELLVSNIIIRNSTISSYVIVQNLLNSSTNISNTYLSSLEITNTSFYYFSFIGNLTVDGCNISTTKRGYTLFYITPINSDEGFLTIKNSNIEFLVDDGYYNYLFSGTKNYTVVIDNSVITKSYLSMTYSNSIEFTDTYFLFCEFYLESPVFYSRNTTYLETPQFQFQFYFIEGDSILKDNLYGSFYVINSSFINSPPNTNSITLYLTNNYYNSKIITPVYWIDTVFYLVANPFFYYNGDMPTTYENCYFSTISTIRGTENSNYISSCPDSVVTINGSETYWAWGAELVSIYQNCELVCSSNVQFICDDFALGGGGGDISISLGLIVSVGIFAVVIIGTFVVAIIFVIIRRRKRRAVVRRSLIPAVPPSSLPS